jgi:hypothetical protein
MVQRPLGLSDPPPFPQSASRQVDNFNYSDDGGIADRWCGYVAVSSFKVRCVDRVLMTHCGGGAVGRTSDRNRIFNTLQK